MANYNEVKYGSSGNDVLELQKQLNSKGYSLEEDGIFGSATQGAVRDYQTKNNLTVDGIVGNQTWGSIYSASTAATQLETPDATQSPAKIEVPKFEYKPSDTVTQAEALLQQHIAQKPGPYQSTWNDQLNDILQKILNREEFSYDLNGDMLYQQYKDQYTTQGKMAKMDTMGQAATMTGGYGNSYAQTAGQQAYQGQLQKLNDIIPELYQLALSKYNAEGSELKDQAALIAGMEDRDYGRYRDQQSDYYTDLQYLTENARYMSETEYQRAMDDFNIKYGSYRDTVGDQQWQAQFDEAKRQYDEQMALSQSKSSSSGSRSSGDGGGYDNGNRSTQEIKNMQISIGVEPDGKWGPASKAAAGGLSADEAWQKYFYEGTLGNPVGYAAVFHEPKGGVGPDYSDWDAGEWEHYFAVIRQSEGEAAALEELQYFTRNGLIPTKMVNYAAIGARGGQKGH